MWTRGLPTAHLTTGMVWRSENRTLKNYYRFSISGDGYYTIVRWRDGNSLSMSGPTQSGSIKTGLGAGNHLHVECNGNIMSLTVNGQKLSTVSDDSFDGGAIALTASSLPEGKYPEVSFDNLKITSI